MTPTTESLTVGFPRTRVGVLRHSQRRPPREQHQRPRQLRQVSTLVCRSCYVSTRRRPKPRLTRSWISTPDTKKRRSWLSCPRRPPVDLLSWSAISLAVSLVDFPSKSCTSFPSWKSPWSLLSWVAPLLLLLS